MEYTLTITSNDASELASLLSGLSGGSTLKSASKKAVTPAAASAAPASSETVETGGKQEAEVPTMEKLREMTSQLIQDGKTDAVKTILAKYDAKKVAVLDKAHYAAYYADIKALA